MKKRILALVIAVAVLVGAAGTLFLVLRSETHAQEISLETAQALVNQMLEVALSDVSPTSAQYIASASEIEVKDIRYGTSKDILLTCDIHTIDVYRAVTEGLPALLSVPSQDENGREMVSTQVKPAINALMLPMLEQAEPLDVPNYTITVYDTHDGLRIHTTDDVINTVSGGTVRLMNELREMTSYADENGQMQPLTTNVRSAAISCVELWYNTTKPVTQGPLVQWIEKFKALFKSNFIDDNRWSYILKGLGVTLQVTFYALLLGLAIGVVIAAVRSTHDKTIETSRGIGRLLLVSFDRICRVYLTVIRGTPVVVQLMLIYYVIFASSTNKIFVASLAFGINSGAYVAEIIRSGIMSVDHGQFEAGRSLGFGYLHTMLYIVIPQALRNVLPSLANEFIVLLKETSVAGYVALQDLTKAGDIIRSRTYNAFMPLLAVAVIYLVMVMFFTWLVGKLERRLRRSER